MRPGDIRNTISLDQEAASRIGGHTRFASLALGGGDLSWNRKGVKVPSESSAARVIVTQTADSRWASLDPAWFPDLAFVYDGRNSLADLRLPAHVGYQGVGLPPGARSAAR